MLPLYQLQRTALYMDSPSLADRFSIRVKTRLYIRPLCGDAISWPSMYATSGASGESLALETGLSVNVRFGSFFAVQTAFSSTAAFERIGITRVLWTLDSTSYQRCFKFLRTDTAKVLMSSFSIVERFDVV